MASLKTSLILATAIIAVAGCAPKRPKQLPPPPRGAQQPPEDQRMPVQQPPLSLRAEFQRSVVSDTVHFALDQYDIDPQARAILDSQASWLARNPQVRITIEGHCDERGTREYNLALGDRRANSAKNYLAARGVDPRRITTISYGKERPIALGSDEASWAQNRRAVTVVLE